VKPMFRMTVRCLLLVVICGAFPTRSNAADAFSLTEDYTNPREFAVTVEMKVTGKMQASAGDKKTAINMKLNAEAELDYDERRLPPAGRDSRALRCVRYYRSAHASIQVDGQTTLPRLRQKNKLIVAEGQPNGVRYHSPERPLFFTELELLGAPGDSLSVLALLPTRDVEIGDTWKPDDWAAQFFTSLEAVEKGGIECTAKSLENDLLQVHFAGEFTGAIYGAFTTVTVDGDFWFDVKNSFFTKMVLKQTEKRTIGVVSQGLDVEAQVTLNRALKTGKKSLSDESLAGVPLEPNPANLLIAFDSNAWNVRFYHDRLWHLYKHERDSAAFRLVDHGSFIAQCKIAPLKTAKPGEHLAEDRFLKDIQTTLGEQFQGVTSVERIKGNAVDGEDGRYIYRVETFGKIGDHEVTWIHYLIAASDGRQIALIFTVGKDVQEKFEGRDLQLATSIEFLPVATSAQQATEPAQVDRTK